MKEKLSKLKEVLKKEKEDYLFLDWEDPNHFWLLEEKIENSYIIIKRRGKPEILMSPLESFDSKEFILKPLKKENFPKRALVNKDTYKIKYNKLIKPKQTGFFVRRRKTREEINKIKLACEFTDKCFLKIVEGLKKRKYVKEKDVEREIRVFAAKNDLEIAFDPIVASQKNAATPHHNNTGILRKGFLIVDFGFKYQGYSSDMTRTLYLGEPTKEEKELYEKVLRSQLDAINQCKEGILLKEIDENVRKSLGKYSNYFIHSLGHGIGVKVHEEPFFKEKEKIQIRDVFTIEPGIYIKNELGIRIEDTIFIEEKETKILTKTSKKLVVIN
ncbi:MAG: M24 family metallopeptidase [Candidatus Woesearchaeota archaeon]